MDKLRRRIEGVTKGMEDCNVIPVRYMRDLLSLLNEAEEEWKRMQILVKDREELMKVYSESEAEWQGKCTSLRQQVKSYFEAWDAQLAFCPENCPDDCNHCPRDSAADKTQQALRKAVE